MEFSAANNYAIRSDFTTFLVCNKVARLVTDLVAKSLRAKQFLATPKFHCFISARNRNVVLQLRTTKLALPK